MENKKTENSYSHILKYTSIFGGVQGLNILISIVRNKLAALLIGPVGFGLVSLFTSTVKFVSDASNLGLSFSAVKSISEVYNDDDDSKLKLYISNVRILSFITAIIGTLLCIALSPFLSKWTFGWGNHTLHFILLSPIVFMTAICGGEMAILKGTRCLQGIARITIITVLSSLIISAPIYYFFGQSGIVPVLLLIAFVILVTTLTFSYSRYPLHVSFHGMNLLKSFRECSSMLRMGIAFLFAGILGSGAELIIRSYLNNEASLEIVGFYNSGYVLIMTYASMVFTSMDTDYFPRLSAVKDDTGIMNVIVNRQIEICLFILSPLLIAFIMIIPILLPLLYSKGFMPVVSMVQVATFSMFFRSITYPLSYITLAKGNTRAFMILESFYNVFLVVSIVIAFNSFQLLGVGIAISLTSIFDFIIVLSYCFLKYDYRMSHNIMSFITLNLPLLFTAYFMTLVDSLFIRIIIQVIVVITSSVISIFYLQHTAHLWQSIISKWKYKFKRNID